jgi:uncharacterized membrane protein YfcA
VPVTEFLAAVAVAAGVAAQALTGFGFSLVSAPFLVAAYRAPTGVQLNLVLSMAVNLAVLAREHRHVDGRAAALLLAPALLAVVPAAYVARRVSSGSLTVTAGVVCLLAVAFLARGNGLRRGGGRAGTASVGLLSGVMNVFAGMSGPPVVLFALGARWPVQRARPTLQLFFLGLNVVTVVSLGWPDRFPAVLAVGFALGVLGSTLLRGRPSQGSLRTATLAIAALGSALAIVRGLTA